MKNKLGSSTIGKIGKTMFTSFINSAHILFGCRKILFGCRKAILNGGEKLKHGLITLSPKFGSVPCDWLEGYVSGVMFPSWYMHHHELVL